MSLIINLFLNEFVIFILLFGMLALLSVWVLRYLQEIQGYILGWVAGIFLMILYGLIIGEPSAGGVSTAAIELDFFGVIIPVSVGLVVGFFVMYQVGTPNHTTVRQRIEVTGLTTLNLAVIFLMFVSDGTGRRMIGLFAISFIVGAVFTWGLYPFKKGGGRRVNQPPPPEIPPAEAPPPNRPTAEQRRSTSTVSQIREHYQDRDQQ